MLFEGRYKTQDYFRYFLLLFSVPSFIFSKGAYSCLPSKDSLNCSLSLFKGWFHLRSFYSDKMLLVRLHTYIYRDLLKLKAYKIFENSDADLSWLRFLKNPTCILLLCLLSGNYVTSGYYCDFCRLYNKSGKRFIPDIRPADLAGDFLSLS